MTSQGHRGSAGAKGRRQLAGENCHALGLRAVLGHSSRHLEPSRGHCSTNRAMEPHPSGGGRAPHRQCSASRGLQHQGLIRAACTIEPGTRPLPTKVPPKVSHPTSVHPKLSSQPCTGLTFHRELGLLAGWPCPGPAGARRGHVITPGLEGRERWGLTMEAELGPKHILCPALHTAQKAHSHLRQQPAGSLVSNSTSPLPQGHC